MVKVPRADLVRIPKHQGYYMNPISKKITYRVSRKGEAIKITTGETSIVKAKEHVEIELEKRRSGMSESAIKRMRRGETNPTIEHLWFEEFLLMKAPGKEASTLATYNRSWNQGLSGFWKTKHVSDLTDKNLTAYKHWYLKTNPKRHVERTLIHFKMFVNFILKQKHILIPPDWSELDELPELVEKTARRKKVGRVYTDAEVKALKSSHEKFLNESTLPQKQKQLMATRLKIGIMLGLRGLRKMEAMKLKRSEIDLKKKMLKVWSAKNFKWREIPITDDLIPVIKEQLDAAVKSDWLFPMETDPKRNLSGQVFDNVWYEGRRLAGIVPKFKGDARFHDLRHTFATWTAEQAWPEQVACGILDMSPSVYRNVYAKPRFESKTEWMNKTFPGDEDEV